MREFKYLKKTQRNGPIELTKMNLKKIYGWVMAKKYSHKAEWNDEDNPGFGK